MSAKTKPAGAATPPTGSTKKTPPIVPARPGFASRSGLAYALRQAINEAVELDLMRAELRIRIERLTESTKEGNHGI